MAVDETLLESAVEQSACTLRLYRWSEPTISLGYFQKHVVESEFDLPMVRRLSGGGAILHHHELTYSCAIPAGHLYSHDPQRLYEVIHTAIITVLVECGVHAQMRGQADMTSNEVFHCFGRGDARDVLLDGHKILGSAQRRRHGAVLQHGSLLLRRSEFARQFPGIEDLAPQFTPGEELSQQISTQAGKALAEGMMERDLTAAEKRRAADLQQFRYGKIDWNRRK